jgi:dTDP-glucose pyrophosphorylase
MKALILAGGKGTRMLPLTKNCPKSLVEVNNRPFLWFIIDTLKKAGIEEFIIVFGSKKRKFENFLKKFNLKATLIFQKIPLGTGDAVKITKTFFENQQFLVIAGDQLFSVSDIKSLINSKHKNCLSAIYHDEPKKYGVLNIKNGKVLGIIEKPDIFSPALINTSLYKFDSNIFRYLDLIKLSPRNEYELTEAVSLMAQDFPIYIKKIKDFWVDFGSIDDIPIVDKKLKEIGYIL